MFDFLRGTRHFRWLAYTIEWVAPIVVTLAFTFSIITSLQRSSDLRAQARQAQLAACGAIAKSDAALLVFLNARITTTEGRSFLVGLTTAYANAEKACLVTP